MVGHFISSTKQSILFMVRLRLSYFRLALTFLNFEFMVIVYRVIELSMNSSFEFMAALFKVISFKPNILNANIIMTVIIKAGIFEVNIFKTKPSVATIIDVKSRIVMAV